MNTRQELRIHIRRRLIEKVQEEREDIQNYIRYLERRIETLRFSGIKGYKHSQKMLKDQLKEYQEKLSYTNTKFENLLIHTPKDSENKLLI
nr:hypothetical protein [Chrysanthemum yellow edge associated virus 1]